MNRRSYLSSLGGTTLLAVAGCLGGPQTDEPTLYHLEITVQNDHDRDYDARVLVTDAQDEIVLESAFTVEPGVGRGFGDDLEAGTYTIEVRVDGRLSLRSYWDTDLCDVHQSRVTVGADGRGRSAVRCADVTTTAAPDS